MIYANHFVRNPVIENNDPEDSALLRQRGPRSLRDDSRSGLKMLQGDDAWKDDSIYRFKRCFEEEVPRL
jgi:hypothetical protein